MSGGLPASYAVAPLARELRHERRPKGEEAALLASSRALAQTPPLDLVCGSSTSEDAALAFEPRWAPAVVAVELAGAHAEVRLVVTNMWGDQTLLDVDCDE